MVHSMLLIVKGLLIWFWATRGKMAKCAWIQHLCVRMQGVNARHSLNLDILGFLVVWKCYINGIHYPLYICSNRGPIYVSLWIWLPYCIYPSATAHQSGMGGDWCVCVCVCLCRLITHPWLFTLRCIMVSCSRLACWFSEGSPTPPLTPIAFAPAKHRWNTTIWRWLAT